MSLSAPSPVAGLDLEARLASLLDFVGESAKDATSFAVEQAPLVAREIVHWHIARHSIGAIVGLGFVVAMALVAWHSFRRAKQEHPGDGDGFRVFAVVMSVGAACLLVLVLVNATFAAKGIIAPRLVVIDEIRSIGGRR